MLDVVSAGDGVSQGLGRQLVAAQRLPLFVAALHQAGEQVLALVVGRSLQPALYPRDCDSRHLAHGVDASPEEGVRQPSGIGPEPRQAAEGCRNLAPAVESLDGRHVDQGALG